MKNILKYTSIVIGCILIAIGYNVFMLPNRLISFGVLGISSLLSYNNVLTPAINLFILNIICLLIGYLVFDIKVIKKYILPSILVPLFLFLTSNLFTILKINIDDLMLNVLAGSFISGYGYSLIYKAGDKAGVTFLLEEAVGKVVRFHTKLYSWFVDIFIIIIYYSLFGLEKTLYSIIIIFITKYMITKARFGINDSKMFYIITSKEKEIKNYIIHDLKYELTVLDVKGGFTKKNNKIFLSIISSSDYYKLKSGIKTIDPNAFIAITDTYDVVNRKSF